VKTGVNPQLCLRTGEEAPPPRSDFTTLARGGDEQIGYSGARAGGFDAHSCAVLVALDQQSPDIAQGVTSHDFTPEIRSDQGWAPATKASCSLACDETPELMPCDQPGHRLARSLAEVRPQRLLAYSCPQAKNPGQRAVYRGNDDRWRFDNPADLNPTHGVIDGISDCSRPAAPASPDDLWRARRSVPGHGRSDDPARFAAFHPFWSNPRTGQSSLVGGPRAIAGLTGAKSSLTPTAATARHGGWCLLGKDPTKVDRLRCLCGPPCGQEPRWRQAWPSAFEVQLSLCHRAARRPAFLVQSFGTERLGDEDLTALVQEALRLRPGASSKSFGLRTLPQEARRPLLQDVPRAYAAISARMI